MWVTVIIPGSWFRFEATGRYSTALLSAADVHVHCLTVITIVVLAWSSPEQLFSVGKKLFYFKKLIVVV